MTDPLDKQEEPLCGSSRKKVQSDCKQDVIEKYNESKQMAGDKVKVYPLEEKAEEIEESEETDKLSLEDLSLHSSSSETCDSDNITEYVPVQNENMVLNELEEEGRVKIAEVVMEEDKVEDVLLQNEKEAEEPVASEIKDTEPCDESSVEESSKSETASKAVVSNKDNAPAENKEPASGLGDTVIVMAEDDQSKKFQVEFFKKVAPELYVAMAKFDPEEESKSCCSCCLTCFFQTCNCNLSGIFNRSRNWKVPSKPKEELFTPTLQKASVIGASYIKKAIFPLVQAVAREIWVFLELATVLIGLILSIVTVSFDDNQVFNIVHFVLIVLSSALAIIDATYSLLRCQSCRLCYSHMTKGIDRDEEREDGETDRRNKCLKCLYWCNRKLDSARLIVTEVLVYPLLVCDIFELLWEGVLKVTITRIV